MKQMANKNNISTQDANKDEDEVCQRCCTNICKKMNSNSASGKEMTNWKMQAKNTLQMKLKEVQMLQDQNEKLKIKIKEMDNMNNGQPEAVDLHGSKNDCRGLVESDHNQAMVLPSPQSECKKESKPKTKLPTTVTDLQMEILKLRKVFAMLPVWETLEECVENFEFILRKELSPECNEVVNAPEVHENKLQWIELYNTLTNQRLLIKHTILSQQNLIKDGEIILNLPMPASLKFHPLPKPAFLAHLECKEELELMAYLDKFPLPEAFAKISLNNNNNNSNQ
ncbi:C6 finger domain transcription factor nscR [Trichinella pseudospiralis]